jgi:hypothetical protein
MPIDVGGGRTRVGSPPPRRRSSNGPTAGYGYGGHGANYSEYTNLRRQTGTYDPALAAQGMTYGGGGRGGGRGGGGYGGGGGGYRDFAAEEEARKAKQRALVEQLYKQGLGQLNAGRAEAQRALPGFQRTALADLARIYAQNQGQTKAFGTQIGDIGRNVLAGLGAESSGLLRDLMAQGADTTGLGAALAQYQGDARATQGAGDAYNARLAQVMANQNADQRALTGTINQSAQGQLSTGYQQALAALQAQRVQALMGLA